MKTVLYYSDWEKCYIMTSKQNYNSYIQNARDKHVLKGVDTLEKLKEFIDNACKWWNAKPEDFEIIS